jgi:hypothetical protein
LRGYAPGRRPRSCLVPAVRESPATEPGWSLVLDEVRMLEAEAAFLPHGGPRRVIATSRDERWSGLARQVALGPLPATRGAPAPRGRACRRGGARRRAARDRGRRLAGGAGSAPRRHEAPRAAVVGFAPRAGSGSATRASSTARRCRARCASCGLRCGRRSRGLAADGPALVPGTPRAGHRGCRSASCLHRVGLGPAGRSW